jgi:hypothetical protein
LYRELQSIHKRLLQPCDLFKNTEDARQQLFTAAAALYSLTGDATFQIDADEFFKYPGRVNHDLSYDFELFHVSWSSVWTQGVAIMAGMPSVDSKWRDMLRESAEIWSDCSSGDLDQRFCECAPLHRGFQAPHDDQA